MATKKATTPIQVPEEETAPPAPAARTVAICGHINMQHYGANGRPEKLTCDLKKGHTGDHHSKYERNVGVPEADEKGRSHMVYHQEEADAYWNDAAGKPAGNVLNTSEQPNMLQKELIMDILSRHPEMSAEEAMLQAKGSPAWNMVSEPG